MLQIVPVGRVAARDVLIWRGYTRGIIPSHSKSIFLSPERCYAFKQEYATAIYCMYMLAGANKEPGSLQRIVIGSLGEHWIAWWWYWRNVTLQAKEVMDWGMWPCPVTTREILVARGLQQHLNFRGSAGLLTGWKVGFHVPLVYPMFIFAFSKCQSYFISIRSQLCFWCHYTGTYSMYSTVYSTVF